MYQPQSPAHTTSVENRVQMRTPLKLIAEQTVRIIYGVGRHLHSARKMPRHHLQVLDGAEYYRGTRRKAGNRHPSLSSARSGRNDFTSAHAGVSGGHPRSHEFENDARRKKKWKGEEELRSRRKTKGGRRARAGVGENGFASRARRASRRVPMDARPAEPEKSITSATSRQSTIPLALFPRARDGLASTENTLNNPNCPDRLPNDHNRRPSMIKAAIPLITFVWQMCSIGLINEFPSSTLIVQFYVTLMRQIY